MYLTIPYLEELRDGNAINGVRFLTPEHLKQHVFHAGKIVRLNISVRWRKNGLTDELRDHTPELEEAIDILWILLITILLPN